MMARSSKAPSIGRIQMRKTNFSKSSLSACNARPVHTDGPISDIGHRDKGDSNFAFHGCSERRNLDKSMRSAFHSKVDLVTQRCKVDGFCQKCLGAILQCLAFRIRVPIGVIMMGYVWS